MGWPSCVRRTTAMLAASLAAANPTLCAAASLEVTVVDDDGRPVPCVAVYANPQASGGTLGVRASSASIASLASAHAAPHDPHCGHTAHAASEAKHAVMDQKDNAFVPHMLVIERGTAVTFPNSDSVSHHVYSFSEAKRFELALYKGNQHPPLVFDRPGVVVLGCNIHDGMLGYVVVVDTPHFAMTDANGIAILRGLATGAYSVELFTPRVKPKDTPAARMITLTRDFDGDGVRLELAISGRLAAPHRASGNLTWHRY